MKSRIRHGATSSSNHAVMCKAFFFFLCLFLAHFLPLTAFAQDSRIVRCIQYKDVVESILSNEGVDPDFFFLMAAESGCKSNATSPKGAKGFWQLMKATASRFGCDDREEIVCSTRAAARYIKSLQKKFDRFEDVVIAYNMGGHNYKRFGATKEARGLVYAVMKFKKEWKEKEVK